MNEELKRCPVCSHPGEMYRKNVRCSDVECFLHYIRMPVNEWQKRPIEDALRAENERMRDALKEIQHAVDYSAVKSKVTVNMRTVLVIAGILKILEQKGVKND
jgi:hypothetical protein